MSSRVSPASATAARHASTVRSMSVRPRGRPTADWPMPEITARRSSGGSARAHGVPPRRAVRRTEQGEEDVVVLLEDHLDGHAGPDVLGLHVDQVGGQPHARLLVDGHQTDHVGLATRDPLLDVARCGPPRWPGR